MRLQPLFHSSSSVLQNRYISIPFRMMASSSVPSIAKNFPDSTASPSQIFHYPGVTHTSTEVTRRVLEENDRKYDIYEKARFAHNHFPHSILTRYALGAPPQLLEDTWKHDEPHLARLDPTEGDHKVGDLGKLPEAITRENWDHPDTLGFKDAYSKYICFFHDEIERLGPVKTLEEYVFSPQSNWGSANGHPGGQMLVRMMAGVLHPFIHTGFGVEFRDRVVLAEGLAEAAIHDSSLIEPLYPDTWPQEPLKPTSGSRKQITKNAWGDVETKPGGKSLLEIFAAFLVDDKLVPAKYDKDMTINDRIIAASADGRAARLVKLASEWSLSDEELGDETYHKKLEEVGVLVTLLACATGRKGHEPKVDFFLMHTLTSSIFLPSYFPILDPPKRRALLQTYMLSLLVTYVARGKPRLDLDYLMEANVSPVGPGTTPGKGESKDTLSTPSDPVTRNVWQGIVESSLYAQDSHTPKAIRSLLHYATLYGNTPEGGFIGAKGAAKIVPGLDKLDGTIFVRSAGLIMDVMGWCREGQAEGGWTFDPIGYEEVW